MQQTVHTDIAIIGGGIAGLWLLNRLRQQGFSVILLESNTLGGGQTSKSQGIIHGGMKYALQGMLTPATRAIADMPTIWKKCLEGTGEINLSHVPILSSQQYLWSNGSVTSKIAGFFAGLTLKSHLSSLEKNAFPEIFKHPQFQGQVYALDEMVIDVPALLSEMSKPHQDVIFKIDPPEKNPLQFDSEGKIISFEMQAQPLPPITLKAKKYIFTAGSGNAALLSNVPIRMQRRPLHMVVVKHDMPYAVYAHCLGLSSTPRITITTHRAQDGKTIWYLGGQLAEEGIARSSAEQTHLADSELKALFPWLDFSNARFASFLVDRAESLQPDGSRPDSCFMQAIHNLIVAWPTKLALAPQLTKEIIQCVTDEDIQPSAGDIQSLQSWPTPAIATPIWDQLL